MTLMAPSKNISQIIILIDFGWHTVFAQNRFSFVVIHH